MPRRSFRDYVGRSQNIAHLLPNELTEAGFWFMLQAMKVTTTFHAFQWMSKFISSDRDIVEEYADFLEEERGAFEKEKESDLSFYENHMLNLIWADEVHFSKIIDMLIIYLVDLIACCYTADASKIPSKAKFDIAFIRKFKTIGDAVKTSVLAEIERISRSGFAEILSEAKRVTSCELPKEVETSLRKYVSLRNDIVHGQGAYRGIVEEFSKKKRKPLVLVRHSPGDTYKAEYVAAEVVGIFEKAAIEQGVKITATKADIFKDQKDVGLYSD